MFSEYKSKGLFFSGSTSDACYVVAWAMKRGSLQPQGTKYDREGAVRGEVDFKKDVDRNRKGLRKVSYPLQLNWKYIEQNVE